MSHRVSALAAFLTDVERLKLVTRKAYVSDFSRRGHSAEHSWHLALGLIAVAQELNLKIRLGTMAVTMVGNAGLRLVVQMDIHKGMLDRDLLLLATAFINNNGDLTQLHQLASTYLDATNLVRWQAAFTQAAVTPVVGAYAPGPTASAYLSHPALRAVIHGGGMPPPVPPPTPNTQMTMTEIFLEYRIQPGATALSAMTRALTFIGGKTGVGKAWAAGFAIGSGFYQAMTYIDPSYGYDLITTYGSEYDDSSFFPPGSQGYVENGDGSYTDGYGNVVASLPQTNYGIPVAPPPVAGQDPYTYWDPDGQCLFLLECTL